MTEDIKLPRKLLDEPTVQKPHRPSHQKVIENIEGWANSPGLRPPTLPDPEPVWSPRARDQRRKNNASACSASSSGATS
jgi:hypothetical protein